MTIEHRTSIEIASDDDFTIVLAFDIGFSSGRKDAYYVVPAKRHTDGGTHYLHSDGEIRFSTSPSGWFDSYKQAVKAVELYREKQNA